MLPSVFGNGYGLELKEKGKSAGERANRRAFFDAVADPSCLPPAPDSAVTQKQATAFSKGELDRILANGEPVDAAVVLPTIVVFLESLASVIADGLHRELSFDQESERSNRFLGRRGVESLLQDLRLERLLAEEQIEFTDLVPQHPIFRCRNHLLLGPRRGQPALVRRATPREPDWPRCHAAPAG